MVFLSFFSDNWEIILENGAIVDRKISCKSFSIADKS